MRRIALLAATASLVALAGVPVATTSAAPAPAATPKPTPAPSPRPGGGIRGHVKPFDGATGGNSS